MNLFHISCLLCYKSAAGIIILRKTNNSLALLLAVNIIQWHPRYGAAGHKGSYQNI